MKKLLFISCLSFLISSASAQDVKFSVDVNLDSVLLGNVLEVTFVLENASGQSFAAPNFSGFQIYSGPYMMNSMTYINGEMSQFSKYTYQLQAEEVGQFFIAPASIQLKDEVLETDPVTIWVLPNPDNKIQSPKKEDSSPKSKKKPKKRQRIYRI